MIYFLGIENCLVIWKQATRFGLTYIEHLMAMQGRLAEHSPYGHRPLLPVKQDLLSLWMA